MTESRVQRLPRLTKEEEVDLARRIERGDKEALKELLLRNEGLIISIAQGYISEGDLGQPGLELSDLMQEGSIGAQRAAEKFDWRRNNLYSTYATWWIRQAIQRAVANKSKLIRVPQGANQKFEHIPLEVLEEVIDDMAVDPQEALDQHEFAAEIQKQVATLEEPQQSMVRMKFGLDPFDYEHSFAEVGRAFGYSLEWARVLIKRALEILEQQVKLEDF